MQDAKKGVFNTPFFANPAKKQVLHGAKYPEASRINSVVNCVNTLNVPSAGLKPTK